MAFGAVESQKEVDQRHTGGGSATGLHVDLQVRELTVASTAAGEASAPESQGFQRQLTLETQIDGVAYA